MKNTFRSILLVVLTVIYCCFNIFLANGQNLVTNSDDRTCSISNEEYCVSPFDYSSLLYRTVDGRGVFTTVPNLPLISLHYRFSNFSDDNNRASLHYSVGFSKYLVYSATIVLWFQSVDIVFPAHYFW